MNRKRAFAFAAMLLALALCGCQLLGDAPIGEHEVIDDGNHVLVDYDDFSVFDGLQAEYPQASDVIALPGERIAPAGTLLAAPTGVGGKLRSMNWGQTQSANTVDEMRAVWFSYLEMNTMLTGKTGAQFRRNIGVAFDNVAALGLNTIIVQVRPFGDALYNSAYFPWSHVCTGTQGKNPGYDPLQVMVEEAKGRGLRIEAWVNPYRVRPAGSTLALSSDNKAKEWLEAGSTSVVNYNGVISYNPASAKAQSLIVEGVREIVKNYDVDGVHIDDYFYPTTDSAFDKASYNSYKSGGGTKSLADWRRANVEALLKKMYGAIKEENQNVVFGVSPQSNLRADYSTHYLNVQKIVSSPGYCDYIMPQVYFGFKNDTQPYAKTIASWNALLEGSDVQLYIGLAAYKCGAADSGAGAGKSEWQQNADLLGRMVTQARSNGNCGGFALYRYESLFRPDSSVKAHIAKETKALQAVLD